MVCNQVTYKIIRALNSVHHAKRSYNLHDDHFMLRKLNLVIQNKNTIFVVKLSVTALTLSTKWSRFG